MKEGSWGECLENNYTLKISPDNKKAKSLIETAKGRLEYLKDQNPNEKAANYIFEGYYSSILEILHSIILTKGFKVSNHFCLGYYLRDVLDKRDLFRLFDDLRFKRNSLVYYGKKMDFETAKDAIKRCRTLIEKLGPFMEKEIGGVEGQI